MELWRGKRLSAALLATLLCLPYCAHSLPSADYVPINVMGTPNSATVVLCKLDWDVYHRDPATIAKTGPHSIASGCGPDQAPGSASNANTLVVPLSEFRAAMDDPAEPWGLKAPTGFIFHQARVGSTLLSNLFATNPDNAVYGESHPLMDVLHMCDAAHCSDEQRRDLLRTVAAAMGRPTWAKHLIFKHQSANSYPDRFRAFMDAFPETPFVFLFRDPIEIVASFLTSENGRATQGKIRPSGRSVPCMRSYGSPPPEILEILGIQESQKSSETYETWCAAHTSMLSKVALDAVSGRLGEHTARNAIVVNYMTLPGAYFDRVLPHFGMPALSPALKARTLEVSRDYSKSGVHLQAGGGVTDPRGFTADGDAKRQRVTQSMVDAVDRYARPMYMDLISHDVACAEGACAEAAPEVAVLEDASAEGPSTEAEQQAEVSVAHGSSRAERPSPFSQPMWIFAMACALGAFVFLVVKLVRVRSSSLPTRSGLQ